jgi:hypothetical protein
VLIMKITLWENNPNFVKNLPIMYSNVIIIMVTASEKYRRLSYRPSYLPQTVIE